MTALAKMGLDQAIMAPAGMALVRRRVCRGPKGFFCSCMCVALSCRLVLRVAAMRRMYVGADCPLPTTPPFPSSTWPSV